jgi:hypothetical protein
METADGSDPTEVQILLAEYAALRNEAVKRMEHRITLLVTSLTVSAATIAVGVERRSAGLLLIVPVVAGLFGLLIVYHHMAIKELGIYIRNYIEEPLRESNPRVMNWQSTRLPSSTRAKRIFGIWHLPMVLATLVPSAVGLGLGWSFPGSVYLKLSLSAVGVAVMIYYLLAYTRQLLMESGAHARPLFARLLHRSTTAAQKGNGS